MDKGNADINQYSQNGSINKPTQRHCKQLGANAKEICEVESGHKENVE